MAFFSADLTAIRGVFSSRNYAIYAAGNSISLVGLWVQRVAVGWLAWRLTESGFWLGAVAFADLFPVVLIGAFGGVLADRLDRRRLMITGQSLALAQAATLCVLQALGLMTIELLFGLTLLLGCVIAVNQPARLSLVPSLVRPANLTSAVAISAVIFNLARFVGPAVAGLILATAGIAPAFGFNALTYAAMIAALAALDLERAPKRAAGGARMVDEIAEGVRYVVGHQAMRTLLLLLLAVSMLSRPVFELLPGFADAIFARGAQGLAALTSAVGLGAVAGGLWLAQRGSLRGLSSIALASGAISGLAVAVFALSHSFYVALAMMAAAGFAAVAIAVASQTLVQNAVEPAMRGRVMSFWGIIIRGGPALGALAMGTLSGPLGLAIPVFAGGLCALGAALWSATTSRRMIGGLERPP